jgi:diguanylate cyclase (GGDEF)-like protein
MKAINDTHGHTGGDVVIRHMGKVLREVSRDIDTAARLGGEEFALLLAGVSDDKALRLAEKLCVHLASQPIEGIGSITVSIGVACCPKHAQSEKNLYLASDTALYQAKNDGRNRAVLAEPLVDNS